MINLLPEETKQQMRAANANTVLAKCLVFALFGTAFVGLACLSSYYLAKSTISTNNDATDTTSQTNTANSYSSMIDAVLGQQVSYSGIISGIGNALPEGVTAESISINSENINGTISLTARAEKTVEKNDITNGTGFTGNAMFSGYQASNITASSNGSSSYTISFSINKESIQ